MVRFLCEELLSDSKYMCLEILYSFWAAAGMIWFYCKDSRVFFFFSISFLFSLLKQMNWRLFLYTIEISILFNEQCSLSFAPIKRISSYEWGWSRKFRWEKTKLWTYCVIIFIFYKAKWCIKTNKKKMGHQSLCFVKTKCDQIKK